MRFFRQHSYGQCKKCENSPLTFVSVTSAVRAGTVARLRRVMMCSRIEELWSVIRTKDERAREAVTDDEPDTWPPRTNDTQLKCARRDGKRRLHLDRRRPPEGCLSPHTYTYIHAYNVVIENVFGYIFEIVWLITVDRALLLLPCMLAMLSPVYTHTNS